MKLSIIQILLIALFLVTACETTKTTLETKQKVFQSTTFRNIKVFESSSGLGPCEPSIYINPKNTDNIVAGSVINFTHNSFDGGKTWNTKELNSSMGIWGDPCVIADNTGAFYYFHLSDPEGKKWQSSTILDRIVVQRSDDGGRTWNDGSSIGFNKPKQQDKEWAAAHPKTGELYVTWTEFDKYDSDNPNDKSRILFSKSSDKGNTWSNAFAINEIDGNCLDDDLTVEGAVPAISNKGTIYVAWAYNDKIYFDKSEDNGITWLKKDVVVANQPGGWKQNIPGIGRSNGMPVTCVDNSDSKFAGTVYVNWTDQRNGTDNTDVFIASSKDGGVHWSPPVKVNNDATATHQFLTWMSVDPVTGYIYVIYYDRSAYTDNRTDVTMAISFDGGKTFNSKIISEKPFIPNGNVFFGDYNNINAFNNIVRPIWTRVDGFTLSIWTALINL
jgi:hypothetical protein